jgi:hypothetical protein
VIGVFGIAFTFWMIAEGKIRAWRDRDNKFPIVVGTKAES